MRVVTMLQVASIPASAEWYRTVVGLVPGHGGDEFEMLFAGRPYESDLVLQLHRWEAHEHGELGSPDLAVGNGCSLWFETEDRAEFDAVWQRVTDGAVKVLGPPKWNPLAHHHEFTIADLDGYVVAIHTPFELDE
jgi:Glyoxalase/Bleomycin resistance protein/Dioxygenase superfamily